LAALGDVTVQAQATKREPMILTPISPDDLAGALDRFGVGLDDAESRRVFHQIRATSPERAEGPEAERHRLTALVLARNCGIAVHPPGARCVFNWDGTALNGATEAYVILHEIAHFMLVAPPIEEGPVHHCSPPSFIGPRR
jgi:hypothetical protein